MKKIAQHSLIIMACALAVGACKKANLVGYTLPDMIYIYKDFNLPTRDSTTYSFAIKSASLMFDTVYVPVRIMGVATDYDREITWAPVDSLTTATANTDYEVLPAMVPAGSYSAVIPIKIKRNEGLKTNEVRLMMEIQPSKDFSPGVGNSPGTSTSYPGAGTRYLIKINDFLTKPDNWDAFLRFQFGTYSQVKYAFIIQATGRALFPHTGEGALPYGQFAYYKQVCKNALAEYEAVNGPLIDEFGNQVTF